MTFNKVGGAFVPTDGSGATLVENSSTQWTLNEYGIHDRISDAVRQTDQPLVRYDAQNTNVSRFQYTGQMWLPEAGVYHYKFRAYAAHLGRFLQPDPIGYEDSPNLYAYVLNDPVNLVDPLGLQGSNDIWVTYRRPPPPPPIPPIFFGGSIMDEVLGNPGSTGGPNEPGGFAEPGEQGGRERYQEARSWLPKQIVKILSKLIKKPKPKLDKHARDSMRRHGWTEADIQRAIERGRQIPAINKANGHSATRYVDPVTGRSVVVDNVTNEVIHVGGSGYRYGPRSGDIGW